MQQKIAENVYEKYKLAGEADWSRRRRRNIHPALVRDTSSSAACLSIFIVYLFAYTKVEANSAKKDAETEGTGQEPTGAAPGESASR